MDTLQTPKTPLKTQKIRILGDAGILGGPGGLGSLFSYDRGLPIGPGVGRRHGRSREIMPSDCLLLALPSDLISASNFI